MAPPTKQDKKMEGTAGHEGYRRPKIIRRAPPAIFFLFWHCLFCWLRTKVDSPCSRHILGRCFIWMGGSLLTNIHLLERREDEEEKGGGGREKRKRIYFHLISIFIASSLSCDNWQPRLINATPMATWQSSSFYLLNPLRVVSIFYLVPLFTF